MIQKFVAAASNFAVIVLNGLADRIERAAKKVAEAEDRANRRPSPAGCKVNTELRAAGMKSTRASKKSSPDVLNKLSSNLSKNNQHHVPTGRHS